MKFLGRKHLRTCLSMLLVVTCLLASFSFYIDSKAQDQVVDSFYILDEEGNPVQVETTQGDLLDASPNTKMRLFSMKKLLKHLVLKLQTEKFGMAANLQLK